MARESSNEGLRCGRCGGIYGPVHSEDSCPYCEIKRLQAIVDKLLEVGDDLRCYTHDWDWKYGEYWDKELNEAREAVEARGK